MKTIQARQRKNIDGKEKKTCSHTKENERRKMKEKKKCMSLG